MTKLVRLRPKTHSYLKDDDSESKKLKRHKIVCHNIKNINLKIIKTV